jgi:hypothetical protein
MLDTHHGVIEEVSARILSVRTNAPDSRNQMDDGISARFDERLPNGGPFAEIVFVALGNEHLDIVGARALLFDQMTPEEVASTGYHPRPSIPESVAHRQPTRPYHAGLLFAYQSMISQMPSR